MVVLIVLIALTIPSFGVAATAAVAEAAIGGVATAVGAIFILLSVGALIGTWNMAGMILTVVDYGVQLLNPRPSWAPRCSPASSPASRNGPPFRRSRGQLILTANRPTPLLNRAPTARLPSRCQADGRRPK
jgi:hypothetical protein